MSQHDSNVMSVAPLSYVEEGLWEEFLGDREKFFKRGAVVRIVLPDDFDMARVPGLVAEITDRHAVFRSSYQIGETGPARHVLDRYEHPVGDHRPAGPARSAHADSLLPGDLVNVWLSPGPQGEHTLSFGVHEIVTDNWSCARLSAEVGRLAAGDAGAAPEVDYADYAREERAYELPVSTSDHWRRLLADAAELPGGIPVDGPDPGGDPAGERILVLPESRTRALREVSRANRVSPFMVVTALLNMTFAVRYGSDDITLATTASTRTRRFADVQGNFSNVTLLRTRVPAGAAFTEVLAASRLAVLGMLGHQPVPFNRLRALVGDHLRPPRVRVHYLPRHTHHYGTTLDTKPAGAAWTEETDFAPWPLDLGFAEDSHGRVAIWASYDTQLFTHATVEAVVDGCGRLLELISGDSDLTCRDLRRALAA